MNLFFDSLIALFLISSLALAITIFRDRKRPGYWESCHKTISICLSTYLLICLLAVVWGSFIEPRLITINRVSIDLPNFEPDTPVRAALISDVHVGTYKKDEWSRRVAKRLEQEKPDIVFIAGDFIVNKSEQAQYLSSFLILNSSFPTYAVLGDHDYRIKTKNHKIIRVDEKTADIVTETLSKAGVRVLRNETEEIKINGASFILDGIDYYSPLSGGTPPLRGGNLPTIALVHNPDFILDPQSKNADLILAGHTHGGQIRLPFIGPVPPLPTNLPRKFDKGLFTLDDGARLFISSGISESGPRARLFNPPEIVLIELY